MFLSGSFAVTLQCSHQCDHSVPGLEILKEPKGCTKDVPHQYICSVLGVFLQCTTFGEILGTLQAHARKTAKLGTFEMCLQCSQNFPKFSQRWYTAGKLPGHCKCTDAEHLWYIALVLSKFPSLVHCDHTDGNTAKSLQMSHSGTSLVLSLENLKVYPQFTQWEHCGHMTWNTANVLAVFLDCDIWVHHWYFFGNIHSFPVISPMGTSQSHEVEHCECTVHVPAGFITGKLSGKFKMYLQCSRWVHCWYTVHFLVMYLQCSWWEHHYLPPVRATLPGYVPGPSSLV